MVTGCNKTDMRLAYYRRSALVNLSVSYCFFDIIAKKSGFVKALSATVIQARRPCGRRFICGFFMRKDVTLSNIMERYRVVSVAAATLALLALALTVAAVRAAQVEAGALWQLLAALSLVWAGLLALLRYG
jgi:hypothetical protein